ncbi:Putative lipoprotein [hydrothermal vent metagenome]|uniref:Lipoprotein n=1 Tax=hydrothermal vent metagenome TaxID=652676 RepID=A0A3B1DY25_9ZZZZ
MTKNNNKPMNKFFLYTVFIVKFLFGLGLIVWTVMMTLSSDVGSDDDNAFLSTYHKVDDNFNEMIISNAKFDEKYNIRFIFNKEIIDGLSVKDVFLAQRAIKKRSTRKNMINIGKNEFKYEITSKDGSELKNIKLDILITMTTNHYFDKKLEFYNNTTTKVFDITQKGYWNITGTIEVDTHKGYFFIKTNAR